MATPYEANAQAAIAAAMRLRAEIDRFIETFPPVPASTGPTPTFMWAAVERQLTELAATPAQRAMVPDLVSATRKQARFKPPEMVLREILCLAGVLMDETFRPSSCEGGEGQMS